MPQNTCEPSFKTKPATWKTSSDRNSKRPKLKRERESNGTAATSSTGTTGSQKTNHLLGRTAYEILAESHQLRQLDKPDHLISLKELPLEDGVYRFAYNTLTYQVLAFGAVIKPGHELVGIPLEIAELGQLQDQQTIDYYNKKSKTADCWFFLADEYLYGYFKGRPIEIELEGTAFTLDTPNLKLYETADPRNQIDLQQVDQDPYGYHLAYHIDRKNLALFGDGPERIAKISLDQLVKYDPIGMAKKHGLSVGRLPGWDNDLNYPEVIRQLKSYTGRSEKPKSKRKGKRM